MADTVRIRGKLIPFTPKMRTALAALLNGAELRVEDTCIGRPTKQRLAKYGLARYLVPKDWDGPMQITEHGRGALMQANRSKK